MIFIPTCLPAPVVSSTVPCVCCPDRQSIAFPLASVPIWTGFHGKVGSTYWDDGPRWLRRTVSHSLPRCGTADQDLCEGSREVSLRRRCEQKVTCIANPACVIASTELPKVACGASHALTPLLRLSPYFGDDVSPRELSLLVCWARSECNCGGLGICVSASIE